MRKTLIIGALFVGLLTAAGCNDKPETSGVGASPASSFTESAAPSESVPPTALDPQKDVSDVKASHADSTKYPEMNGINLDFVVTNHGTDSATYAVTFAVYDGTGAQVGAALVDTGNSGYGPTKPGGILKVSTVGLLDGGTVPDKFSVLVQSVERTPEA
jgi:hypothetical protein